MGQLPPGAVTDRQISDPRAVGEVIMRAMNRAGTRNRQVAVAVAGSSVITKVIAMPASLSDNDMEEQIKAEADQYIPYPIDEVNLDFQVLGPNPRDKDSVEVLLAACRKELPAGSWAAGQAETLAGLQGRFIVSLNDRPEVREIFRAYSIRSVSTRYTVSQAAAGRPRATSVRTSTSAAKYSRNTSVAGSTRAKRPARPQRKCWSATPRRRPVRP